MGLLTEELPRKVKIAGELVDINWTYRTAIAFDVLMHGEKTEEEKCCGAILLFYGRQMEDGSIELPAQVIGNIPEAFERLLWFFSGGKENQPREKGGTKGYFFGHDDAYICAAFMDQYRIDLTEETQMHWWKFQGLFQSLKEDNEISHIIQYRTAKISNKMPKEQREFLKKMKRIYASPADIKKQKELGDLEEELLKLGGEDADAD